MINNTLKAYFKKSVFIVKHSPRYQCIKRTPNRPFMKSHEAKFDEITQYFILITS